MILSGGDSISDCARLCSVLDNGRNMLIKLAIYQLRKPRMLIRLQRIKNNELEEVWKENKKFKGTNTSYCTQVRTMSYINAQLGITDPFWGGSGFYNRSKAQQESPKSCCCKRGKYNIEITGCRTQNHLLYLALWRSQLDCCIWFWQILFKKDTKQMYRL